MQNTLIIDGMSCGGCVAAVQKALSALPGMQTVTVDLTARHAQVEYDATQLDLAQIKAAIEAAGYDVLN